MNGLDRQQVPTFAVVGRVNMGKSAVIATLLEIDDNELVRISATPGETTRCQPHRVVFGDCESVRFIDTPGFSRPVEAMRAIQQIHGAGTPGLETLRRFVAESGEEFGDEKRLLEPLPAGAGILYVVDPARSSSRSLSAPVSANFSKSIDITSSRRTPGRKRSKGSTWRAGKPGPSSASPAPSSSRSHPHSGPRRAWPSMSGRCFSRTVPEPPSERC